MAFLSSFIFGLICGVGLVALLLRGTLVRAAKKKQEVSTVTHSDIPSVPLSSAPW